MIPAGTELTQGDKPLVVNIAFPLRANGLGQRPFALLVPGLHRSVRFGLGGEGL